MATVPGGEIDTSPDLSQIQKDLINKVFEFVGIDEGDLDVTENSDGSLTLHQESDEKVVTDPSTGDDITIDGAVDTGAFIFNGEQTGQIPTASGNIEVTVADDDAGVVGQFEFLSPTQGISASVDEAPTISDDQKAYLLGAALDNNADPVTLASISKAIDLLSQNGDGAPDDLMVGYVRFALNPEDSTEVRVDASSVDSDVLLAARLLDMTNDSTLVLSGMEKVILVGAGNARVDDSNGMMIVGDTTNQNITGGDGADTLVGGGGEDTLTGGAGEDEFGFIAKGHYTVTDFTVGEDMLAFGIDGVDSVDDLLDGLVNVIQNDGNTTFDFGENGSITLVGVDASQLTEDMVKFTIG